MREFLFSSIVSTSENLLSKIVVDQFVSLVDCSISIHIECPNKTLLKQPSPENKGFLRIVHYRN